MEEPIRILSDLHLGHSASLAREIEQIAPLYEGVRTVIFNGDTVEMRSASSRARARRIMREVEAFCARQEAATHFINGNHDPVISTLNHVELGDGNLLVTHGDVLFHDVAPWGEEPERLGALHDRFISELKPSERRDLEKILATNKRVSQAIDYDGFTIPDGPWGQFTTFMRQTWPPRRLVRMVSSWTNTPTRALDLVRLYRPRARCIIVGHTHYPGVWHRHGCCVVNTGSYLPVLGRLAVDYAGGVVTARKVVLRNRRFRLGRVIARLAIDGRARAVA